MENAITLTATMKSAVGTGAIASTLGATVTLNCFLMMNVMNNAMLRLVLMIMALVKLMGAHPVIMMRLQMGNAI